MESDQAVMRTEFTEDEVPAHLRAYFETETRGGRRNVHPTVKPIKLMRYLVRLVTPPGGIVLDPFNGSGTTGIASVLEGHDYLGIEREPQYAEIARGRITAWLAKETKDGI